IIPRFNPVTHGLYAKTDWTPRAAVLPRIARKETSDPNELIYSIEDGVTVDSSTPLTTKNEMTHRQRRRAGATRTQGAADKLRGVARFCPRPRGSTPDRRTRRERRRIL